MKKISFFIVASLLLVAFLSDTQEVKASPTTKTLGAIIIGVPPGCDCTVSSGSCYCVTEDTTPTSDKR